MNESERTAIIQKYLDDVREQFESGQAIEHAYRPALKILISSFDDTVAVNDAKHSEHGAPDFLFLKRSNTKIIKGHAEAKDIGKDLNKEEKSEQMSRYAGYANLFLTDYLEFRFFRNGEKYETISLGSVKHGVLHLTPGNGKRLTRELEAFLDQTPEQIRSGKRLAQIMGGKARRIRDNVEAYLTDDSIQSRQFENIYELMKTSLVHDLTEKKFADMYAQTLVYGLFVARYSDTSLAGFTRQEARDLVPRSNPFLRKFFDHIAGADFDTRLTYIVDELCEVFSVSDVANIVHKHLRIQDPSSDAKDPIIHFYEDFLKEYDPELRKQMGAYYTPVPVVRYIVRQVDRILREEFGISRGLASTETITRTVGTQPWRKKGERRDRTTKEITVPRVQILDPAVGTATFLNEVIKFIYEGLKGQEGQWPSYVNSSLLKRLHGFELMMAPYTIAHLKLGMTLRETGVDDLSDRLGVYLTNTLEPGAEVQVDIFSALGLAGAVSEESRLAAIVKNETPVMVVIGNPPYSGHSSNVTKYTQSMIKKYKDDIPELKLPAQAKWLSDDYVKFIAFAEDMIQKNAVGVVAMITNNGYLDNPTFRGMRQHLAKTFDKLYLLDLHGSAKKNEVAPDGSPDQNVFDITQGVSILLAVKLTDSDAPANVYYAEIYGTRAHKFAELDADTPQFSKLELDAKMSYFVPRNNDGREDYEAGVSVASLLSLIRDRPAPGIVTTQDSFAISWTKEEARQKVERLLKTVDEKEARSIFKLCRTSQWSYDRAKEELQTTDWQSKVLPIDYRPFDLRWTVYDSNVAVHRREVVMNQYLHDNLGLMLCRQQKTHGFYHVLIHDHIVESSYVSNKTSEIGSSFPLYIYHSDGTRTPNFNADELKKLTVNLSRESSPEDIFDYIYAALHSPVYREKYHQFLKSDFPRVPVPTQADFDRLVPLGRGLRSLHLIKSPIVDDGDTTFPEVGSNVVEKLSYADGKVWINDTQYFGEVPELAWNFHIGSYQPAQKWLKDRKARELTHKDIAHYQRIIKVLLETDAIMKRIG